MTNAPFTQEEVKEVRNNEFADWAKEIPNKHFHYFRNIENDYVLDIYLVCELYANDNSGCIQHAVKKLLCPGKRGYKDETKDIQEAIDTLQRKLQLMKRVEQ